MSQRNMTEHPNLLTWQEYQKRWQEVSERMLARIPKDPKERKKYMGKRIREMQKQERTEARAYRFCPHCGERLP
jgi:hypothetical protein